MTRRRTSPLAGLALEARIVPAATPPALVRDIQPGTGASLPDQPLALGGQIYFAANDGVTGTELWASDGTSVGTRLVRDINPQGNSNPTELTAVGAGFFFAADSPAGRELWFSDGTSVGTRLVRDIEQFGSSNPTSLTNVNGTLFFFAQTNGAGREVWTSDGTSAGTVMVADILPGFFSSVGGGRGVNAGGVFYFPAQDSFPGLNDGTELWRSDGTSKGTFLVRDINPGGSGSYPASLTTFNGKVAFTAAENGFASEVWISDGTSAGTTKISAIGGGTQNAYPADLTNVAGTLFFTASDASLGRELFKTDGTAAGTVLVRDINPGQLGSNPGYLANVGGKLYLSADDGATGDELWISDGTSAGTRLVREITPGPQGYGVRDITDVAGVAGVAYFNASASDSPGELWRSDGTSTGTTLIDVEPTTNSDPFALVASGTTLYFTGFRSDVGRELFSLTEDLVAPTITRIDSTNADGSYYTGVSVAVVLTFSEPVTLTGGNLVITLDTGVVLTIPPFSGTTVTANYLVAAGQFSTDLNVTAIVLQSGATLADAAGNPADLSLPALNLGVTRDLMINLPPLPPTISDTPDQIVNAGTLIGPLSIVVNDFDSGAAALMLSVTSDNPTLLPASAVTFAGSGSDRSIIIQTQAGLTGVTTLTVTVTDPNGLTATDTIVVTQNGPPTVSNIPNQSVIAGNSVGPLAFTVGGNLTPPDQLTLSVQSNNAVIPPGAVTFGGTGANRTVTVATTAGVAAVTTLTVTVTDPTNGFTASTTFTVTQTPNTPPTISDIGDVSVVQGGTAGPIPFTVGDAETATDSLVVTAVSGNPSLLPDTAIVLGGGGPNRTITINAPAGQTGTVTVTVTVRDSFGVTATDTFVVTITQTAAAVSAFGVGRGPEVAPGIVRVFNADQTERLSFQPFGPAYDCGIRVVVADFTGDGVEDILAGTRWHQAGPGDPLTSSRAAVFDGVTLAKLFEISPFGDSFINGLNLSAGDMNGDGKAEIALSADAGGGARVRIFSPTGNGFVQLADFIALRDANGVADTRYRGGARTAIGDFNGDGFGDLVFTAGIGGGPRVAIYDGKQLGMNGGPKLRGDFFAFEPTLQNGANIAAGDVDGDGKADLVAAPSSGGAPRVAVFSGATLLAGSTAKLADFFAGSFADRGGVRLAVKELDGDAKADIVAGSGPGSGASVFGYRGSSLAGGTTIAPTPFFNFEAFPDEPIGVWVGVTATYRGLQAAMHS